MRLLTKTPWPIGAALEDRIDAACAANFVDRRTFFKRAGILTNQQVPRGWGRWIEPTVASTIATGLGVSPATIHSGLLASFSGTCIPDGAVLKAPKDLVRDTRIFPSGTRVCPGCWTTLGFEPVRHRLPWSFACTEHGTLLLDRCDGCGRRFRAGKDHDRSGPSILSVHPRPGHCTNQPHRDETRRGLGSQACGHPYTSHTVQPASARAINAQQVLNSALDGRPPDVLGTRVTSLEFFDDVRSIGALLTRSEGGRFRPYLSPPPTSLDMSAIVTGALDVLTSPTLESAVRGLMPQVEHHLATWDSTTLALLGRTRPTRRTRPILDGVLALVGRPSTRLRRTIQPSLPLSGLHVDDVSLIAVAQHYERHFVPVTNRLGRLREDLGLLTAAMDLARIAGLPSFPACATHLGLEPRASGQARYVRTRLRDAGHLNPWIGAVRSAALELAKPRPQLNDDATGPRSGEDS